MEKFAFGELEFSVIKIVQKAGRTTVRDVYKSLGSPGSYTTIMTVMSRMADKGDLKREKEGKQYIYWVSESNAPPTNNLLKRIKNKIFGGKPLAMVSYLLESDDEFKEEDLQEIEKIIEKLRVERKTNG
ncbi:MAG: BlaI/MecI/CopY family transcriptional regulator [Parachlamydiaceae bacterium]|nr:BlaI/MecI/CopY family transcriptional regulator [Parachlamydiaceae bacterium]